MSFKLLSSPLQGFTDFRFRNAQNKSTIDSEKKAKASDNQQLLESGEED